MSDVSADALKLGPHDAVILHLPFAAELYILDEEFAKSVFERMPQNFGGDDIQKIVTSAVVVAIRSIFVAGGLPNALVRTPK